MCVYTRAHCTAATIKARSLLCVVVTKQRGDTLYSSQQNDGLWNFLPRVGIQDDIESIFYHVSCCKKMVVNLFAMIARAFCEKIATARNGKVWQLAAYVIVFSFIITLPRSMNISIWLSVCIEAYLLSCLLSIALITVCVCVCLVLLSAWLLSTQR